MKKFKNISLSFLKPALGLVTLALTVAACNKYHETLPIRYLSSLAIVHAAPGTPELSLHVDGFRSSVKGLTYGAFINYTEIPDGTSEFAVTKKDSSRVLVKSSLNLKKGKFYSLFVTDVPAKPAFSLFEDDLTVPAADKANVRFVNMSPDAGSLDLGVTGQTTPVFTNVPFKGASAFTGIAPGAEVTFEIKEYTKTDVVARIEKVKIEKGKIYTIWARGLRTATDSTKLGLELITNK